MTSIVFTATGADAQAEVNGKLTAGMVGVTVQFQLDRAWEGLNIIATFEGSGALISVPLLSYMEGAVPLNVQAYRVIDTDVPWEVLQKANTRLRIGLEGRLVDGTIVITTVWARAGYIEAGALATGEEANQPTPGIYDQIMAAIEAGQLQGKPGDDGVSPTVSVTEIEGGHRVTITDEAGAKSFAVMDGKDGDDSTVEIVDNLSSTDTDKALSARQGKVLREKIDDDILALQKELEADIDRVDGNIPTETKISEMITIATEQRLKDLETSVEEIIADKNYKNIDITIFACPGAGTYEMGRSVAAPTITWSLNKEPASQSLNGEALGVDVRTKAYSGNITSNKTYTLNVTGQKGEKDSASGSFTFYNGVYYGVLAVGATINAAAISSLSHKELRGDFKKTYPAITAGVGQRHAFAFPTRYGTPAFVDADSKLGADFYKANEQPILFKNASEYTEGYDIWLSTEAELGSLKVTITAKEA